MTGSSKLTHFLTLLVIVGTVGALVWLSVSIDESETGFQPIYAVGAILAGLLIITELRLQRSGNARARRFSFYLAFLPVLLFLLYIYAMRTFGYFNWGSVFQHADGVLMMPSMVWDYVSDTAPVILLMLGILAGLGFLKARGALTRTADIILMGLVILMNPMVMLPLTAAVYTSPLAGVLAAHFVDVTSPEEPSISTYPIAGSSSSPPKNLLHIFIESAERTYLHKETFGDIMDPLLEYERRGLTATNLFQVEYTGASIAGMVAANCGIPLMLRPFMTRSYLEKSGEFMPGVTCLGDILGQKGYRQAMVTGWNKNFAGHGIFYKNHGYTDIYGADDVNAAVPGESAAFGADDFKVTEMALQLMRQAQKEGKPFSVTFSTTGGHAPNGYLSQTCAGKSGLPESEPNILHAVKCTNMLIAAMLRKAEAEGLMDNTVLVLQSDHLAPPSVVSDRLAKYERRNFLSISGPGIAPQVQDKPGSMIDIFPTILEALGIPASGGRAALATSLFNTRQTMVEAMGISAFDAAIRADSVLVYRLWNTSAGSVAALK